MTLIQKVLGLTLVTGSGVAGYAYWNSSKKSKVFEPVKVITENNHIRSRYIDTTTTDKSKNVEVFKTFFEKSSDAKDTTKSFVHF